MSRELDAEVARVVFGQGPSEFLCPRCEDERGYYRTENPTAPNDKMIRQCKACGWKGLTDECFTYPEYSTDIAAAMAVFEAVVEATGIGSINADMEDARGEGFVCSVRFGFDGAHAIGPLPLAVCRAALAAMQAIPSRQERKL